MLNNIQSAKQRLYVVTLAGNNNVVLLFLRTENVVFEYYSSHLRLEKPQIPINKANKSIFKFNKYETCTLSFSVQKQTNMNCIIKKTTKHHIVVYHFATISKPRIFAINSLETKKKLARKM